MVITKSPKEIDASQLGTLPYGTLVLLRYLYGEDDYLPVSESVVGRIFKTCGGDAVYATEEFVVPADDYFEEGKVAIGDVLQFCEATFEVMEDPDENY